MRNSFDGIAPRLVYGEGCSKTIASVMAKYPEIKKVMCVMDAGIKAVGIADPIQDTLKEAGYEVTEWAEIERDPSSVTVETGAKLAKDLGIDAFVAIGGGGVLDVTKCMAMLQTNEGKLLDELGVGKPIANMCKPWFAVPTTSGTGSEVTCLSIITNLEIHRKTCVKDTTYLRATAAFLDPELTLGLPKGLTASTGMDALSHAVEAYLTPFANEYSDMWNLEAIKRIVKYLPIAVADGKNIEARSKVMIAASYAGIGFANATLQIGHSIAHALGESTGRVPHGIACAWGLRYAIRRCAMGDHISVERMQTLTAALGLDASSTDKKVLADLCEAKVDAMNKELEVPFPSQYNGGLTVEDKESAYNACITMEQPMLQAGGVKVENDEVKAYFDEMWTW